MSCCLPCGPFSVDSRILFVDGGRRMGKGVHSLLNTASSL
jgi:hypothetical protein